MAGFNETFEVRVVNAGFPVKCCTPHSVWQSSGPLNPCEWMAIVPTGMNLHTHFLWVCTMLCNVRNHRPSLWPGGYGDVGIVQCTQRAGHTHSVAVSLWLASLLLERNDYHGWGIWSLASQSWLSITQPPSCGLYEPSAGGLTLSPIPCSCSTFAVI